MVKTNLEFEILLNVADHIEQTQYTHRRHITRVLGLQKGHLNVALSSKIVNLVRLHVFDNAAQHRAISQVTIVQLQTQLQEGDLK